MSEEKKAITTYTILIAIIAIVAYELFCYAADAFVEWKVSKDVEVYAQSIEPTEPQDVKVVWEENIVVSYEPVTETGADIILPEDVVSMDGFERDVCLLAQTLWGESRGMDDYANSLVAWSICNRVDSPLFPDTIEGVIKQSGQFHGYSASHPISERLYGIAKDVLLRWHLEKCGIENVGRTLPREYLYFYGKDGVNKFRIYNSGAGITDFTDVLPNPYQ